MNLIKTYEGVEITLEGFKGEYPINQVPFEMVDQDDEPIDFSSSAGIFFRLLRARHSTELALVEMTNTDNTIYLDGSTIIAFKPGTYYFECYFIDNSFTPERKRILFKGPFIQT